MVSGTNGTKHVINELAPCMKIFLKMHVLFLFVLLYSPEMY